MKQPVKISRRSVFAIVILIIALVVVAAFGLANRKPIICPDFLKGRQMLPFSQFDIRKGAVAKYEINTNEIEKVVSWYRQNGFGMDGSQDGIIGSNYKYPHFEFVITTYPAHNGTPVIALYWVKD